MQDKQVKVGDKVAWNKVPVGSLTRWYWDGHGNEYHWKRDSDGCSIEVGDVHGGWRTISTPFSDGGSFDPDEAVTIIALDVPAGAMAEHLRELAEVFEVREALRRVLKTSFDEYATCDDEVFNMVGIVLLLSGMTVGALAERLQDGDDTVPDGVAERLYAAGWRPGMTAGDAARVLATAAT